MAAQAIAARTSVWLENDDWSWPGSQREPVELGPPAWVPAVPDRGEPAPAVASAASPEPVAVSVPAELPPALAGASPEPVAVSVPADLPPALAGASPEPVAVSVPADLPPALAGASLARSAATATATGPRPVVPTSVVAAPQAPATGALSRAVVARRLTIESGVAVARPRSRRRRTRGGVLRQRLAACVALAAVFAATFEVAGHLQSVTHSAPAASAAAGPDARHVAAGGTPASSAAHAPAPLAPSGGAALAASASGLILLSRDPDGAALAKVRFVSPALGGPSSFLVYLPPGYRADGTQRYPVLYVLHGDGQLADSVLQFGLTSTLDTVIDNGEIHPLIAVIPDGQPYTDNWRNRGAMRYEDYVIEVQQLADRILPTIANRSGRAIAGFSMGGFGAMHIALDHLDRFSVAESWLGFFNGLNGQLETDAPQFAHLPLTAFLYGGASDTIADPSENAPFAAALRAAGATASSAVYPGGHDFATLHEHLRHMLVFAGHSLSATT